MSVVKLWGHITKAKDPGLMMLGLVCFTIAGFLVAVPVGFGVAGLSFIAMDLATTDRNESQGSR